MYIVVQKRHLLISSVTNNIEGFNPESYFIFELNEKQDLSILQKIIDSKGNSFLVPNTKGVKDIIYKDNQLFFSIDEENILSQLDVTEEDLESLRIFKKNQKLDLDLKLTIKKGFIFDNNVFSLSQNAQLNWQQIEIELLRNVFEPQYISTKSDSKYFLTKDKVEDFLKEKKKALKLLLDNNRDNKEEL